MAYMNWYNDGTVQATNGSANLVFTGAQLRANVDPGQGILIDGVLYELLTVDDDTHATIRPVFAGITGSGKAFQAVPIQGYLVSLAAQVAAQANAVTSLTSAAAAANAGDYLQFLGDPVTPTTRSAIQVATDLFSKMAEVAVASASTCDIGAAASPKVQITGATTITSLGAATHCRRLVRFGAALTLTHNAASLILPGAANITTAAGDTAEFVSDGSGNWRCAWYSRASGQPVNPALSATSLTLSNALTAASATLSGGLTATTGTINGTAFVVNNAAGGLGIFIQGAAGNSRTLYFRTQSSGRWTIACNNEAESGANAGSNFVIQRYDDSGTYIDDAMRIIRATGNVKFSGQVGIGITPTNPLSLSFNGATTDAISVANSQSGGKVWKLGPATGNLGFGFYQSTDGVVAGGFGSDGSLLKGTTSNGGFTGSASVAFEKNGTGRALTLYQQNSSGDGMLVRVDSTNSAYEQFQFSGSISGSIAPATGGSSVSFNTTSARALKMGAQPLTSEVILNARMYRGTWINNPDHEWVGGIADEMGLLVPEGYTPSPTPHLAPHQEGYVPDFFDYSKFIPHLIVQAQSGWARMAAIEARLAAAGIA